jgi:ribosomal protein S27E
VSQQNVVPFKGRRAIDRRGSPDKALFSNLFELDCPDCGAPLCLAEDSRSEALCEQCGTVVGLRVESRTAGARTGD